MTKFRSSLLICAWLVAALALGAGFGVVLVSGYLMPSPSLTVSVAPSGSAQSSSLGKASVAVDKAQEASGVADAVEGGPAATKAPLEVTIGPYRPVAYQVRSDGPNGACTAVSVDVRAAHRDLRTVMRNGLRKWGKAPKEERDAKLTRDPFGAVEHTEKKAEVYDGDVFLTGIPMIDQGGKAYCAVASAARVLQGYGIEITMEDMARLADSSETGGTSLSKWSEALQYVAGEHGLVLNSVSAVAENEKPLPGLIDEHNTVADAIGGIGVDPDDYIVNLGFSTLWDYKGFWMDRDYSVQREVMLSDDSRCAAFDKNVVARVDDSDPLFWSVVTGEVPEEVPYANDPIVSAERGSHMRLIIGYNLERGEVLYSDSWGKGHELKRMDAADALSITKGLYYLTDKN